MLHWYVSSVVIYGCETREFQKAKARRVLIDYWDKKNFSSMIVNIPSTLVECGGHSKYVQRKLVICSSYRNCNLKTCYKEL